MDNAQCDIGLIGLAVMGGNLVLNRESQSKGFHVTVLRAPDPQLREAETERFIADLRQIAWLRL